MTSIRVPDKALLQEWLDQAGIEHYLCGQCEGLHIRVLQETRGVIDSRLFLEDYGLLLTTELELRPGALSEFGIWVRLHYVYPYPHVDQIIPLMAEGKILPYLDIPFQHGSPRILKLMKRPAAAENTLARIKTWRAICPDITLRSTFIVGFPGETEADFEQLLDFLHEAQLDRVGCFQYSPVTGATANTLPDPVPEAVKQERFERYMQTQAEISAAKLEPKIGQTIDVLIDEIDQEGAIGRSFADAPEIDGQVYLDGALDLQPGQIVSARVLDASDYDLWAERIDR